MGVYPSRKRWQQLLAICLLLCLILCACESNNKVEQPQPTTQATATPENTVTPISLEVPTHGPGTPKATATAKPKHTTPTVTHPVLAFYYQWYTTSTWNANTMSDLPTSRYNSVDNSTIDRQLNWAANAGITGFISSWWGPGDQTDSNFAKLLAHSAALEKSTHYHFASTLYFESDAPKLSGTANMTSTLSYIISHYANNPYFFHWQGKPVLFFWNPLGNGRTLAQWASIRSHVDPNNQMIWSAEGVNTTMLSVFDGLHLFSGGYWGLPQVSSMTAVDKGFRTKIDAYNSANGTHKIWAAGIIPGYDDTRVPGRAGTYIVPRDNGTTYATSWKAALASRPEWITITSFNEWYEGATIEPSMNYGTLYLNLTQRYTQQWNN